MSTTLSKGYIKPTTGDRGQVWFPALESNIERVNSHSHDGVNSEKINSFSIQKTVQTIPATGWGTDLGYSTYKQTVSAPANINLLNDTVVLRLTSGEYINPSIKILSATSFEITSNDNTLELIAIYG